MSTSIRIAYIDQTGEMGGAEHLLLTLLNGLPHDAIQPMLICAENGPLVNIVRGLGIPVKILTLPPLYSVSWIFKHRKIFNPLAVFWNVVGLVRSAWRTRRYLSSMRVDLIQTNSAFAHLYGGLAARMIGVPCIWYFHDLVETSRFGGSIALVWRLLSKVLATRVIGVSEAVNNALAIGSRGCVIYAGRSQHNIVKNKVFPDIRTQLGLPSKTYLVGYVGRIAHVKGVDILVQAAHLVVDRCPNAHFVLFGAPMFGERVTKADLVNQVERLNLNGNWHWLGYDPQVFHRMTELDILVLPSRREALGLVLVEAGIAGKAAIASRVGGTPEVIVDDETGKLVTPENSDELADAILHLLKNPCLAHEMGCRAKDRVRRVFGLQRYISEFLELYESLNS